MYSIIKFLFPSTRCAWMGIKFLELRTQAFPVQNILEVPRRDVKNMNFPLQVVKTGTNYGILSAVSGIRTNLQSKRNECFLQRIVETLPAILVVFYVDVSFAYYLTFSKILSQCLPNMKIDKRPLRYYTQHFRFNV